MDRLITPIEFERFTGLSVRDAQALFSRDLVVDQQEVAPGIFRAPLYAVVRYLRRERQEDGDTSLMRERRRQYRKRERLHV